MSEEWRQVSGYEGSYEVSNLGRVRSVDRIVKVDSPHFQKMEFKGRVLRLITHRTKYVVAYLSKNNKLKCHFVHRLVAAAFCPRPPEANEVNHRNAIRNDNCAQNLEWVTGVQNMNHSAAMGRRPPIRLSMEKARAIRAIAASASLSHQEIGHRFGVSKSTVSAVVANRAWREPEEMEAARGERALYEPTKWGARVAIERAK